MPWPVYLAFKHLFPTGRRGARASLGVTLLWSLALATVFFIVLLGFFGWSGVLGRMRMQLGSVGAIANDMLILWLWLLAVVAFVAMIFRSTPFFHAMSILGITLGVTVLLTVQSVMNGFANEYEKVFIQTQGHLDVMAGQALVNPQEVAQVIRKVPGVTLAEPEIGGVVLMRHNGMPATPVVRSFDLSNADLAHDPLAAAVQPAGALDQLDDQSILVGAGVYDRFNLHLGDKVDIYTLTMLDDIKRDEVPMPKELKVVGVVSTGWTGVDQNTVFLSLRLLRELFDFGNQAQAIEVRLDRDDLPYTRAKQAAVQQALQPLSDQRVAKMGPDAALSVETWQELNMDQMKILIVEKTVMFYIMIVIVVVAAFCILCSLATTVVRKTREIGVLGALGASPAQLSAVFCLQGMFIGVVGTLIGIVASLILLHYRQNIVEAFVDQQQLIEFYKFYTFPVEYRFADFVNIIGFTFCICTLAGVLPAIWAARLKPADCLRSD
ncbi:MAG TPA: ABC transporter permease [Opitutales bacterium]|nr:ABC transporter permease [Opitutales bacterium]